MKNQAPDARGFQSQCHPSPSASRAILAALIAVGLASGCVTGEGTGGPKDVSPDTAVGTGGSSGVGGGVSGAGNGTGTDTGAGGSTGSGASSEACDGLDNDGDGTIDNVDVGGDGVCDCLRIATLGFPGQWGQGDVFTDWLHGKSLQGVEALEGAELTAERLASYQVIIVQDVREGSPGQAGKGQGIGRAYSAAEVEALHQWVRGGGGLATLTGYADSSEITNVNALLAPFGVSYGAGSILFGGGGATAPVTHWATHPLTDGVTRVGADNGYPVLGAGTVIAYEPNPGSSDVARAVEEELGHVYVWGDEWVTYNSEWTGHPDYQVSRFWLNALKWLTRSDRCQVALPEIG